GNRDEPEPARLRAIAEGDLQRRGADGGRMEAGSPLPVTAGRDQRPGGLVRKGAAGCQRHAADRLQRKSGKDAGGGSSGDCRDGTGNAQGTSGGGDQGGKVGREALGSQGGRYEVEAATGEGLPQVGDERHEDRGNVGSVPENGAALSECGLI